MIDLYVYRFVDGAHSYWYQHQADVILNENNVCVKDRLHKHPGRAATADEIEACVTITPEMARAKNEEIKQHAAMLTAIIRKGS